ncbi:MAG: helix-turn-helix domain containing protein [Gemmatimonadales bacterium]
MAEGWRDAPSSAARHRKRHQAVRTFRQLRPPEIDALVMAYETGATVYELATEFGINRVTVGKHLRSRGVDTKPPGLASGDVPAAAELYRQGWSLARIAERYNTTANTVRVRLIEVGVAMRDTHGQGR